MTSVTLYSLALTLVRRSRRKVASSIRLGATPAAKEAEMRRERRLLVSTGMSCTFTLLFNTAPGSIMLLATGLNNAALFETMANLVSLIKAINCIGES